MKYLMSQDSENTLRTACCHDDRALLDLVEHTLHINDVK